MKTSRAALFVAACATLFFWQSGCQRGEDGQVTVGVEIKKIEKFERYAKTASLVAGAVLGATERETVAAAFEWVIARVEIADSSGVRGTITDAIAQAQKGFTARGKEYKLSPKHGSVLMAVVGVADSYFVEVDFNLEDLLRLLKAGASGLSSTRDAAVEDASAEATRLRDFQKKNTSW